MTKKALFLTLLIFLTLAPVFSQEKELDRSLDYIEAEDTDSDVMSLFEIQKLIRATDYNRALQELHKYIEKYPDRFDNAESLIRTIMSRRQRYSKLTERVIKVSTENPDDHITPSQIILEMKTLEKNPPEEIKTVITMLEDLHLFKYYAYLFDTIQTESSKLVKTNGADAAVTKIEEGFWIYKEEFQDQWADNPEIVKEAEKIENKLNEYLASFQNADFRKQFTSLIASFIKNVEDDKYEAANANLTQLQNIFTQYAKLRNNIVICGNEFGALYEKQKAIRPEITDASYLPFMQRFIAGVSSIPDSGLVGVMDYEFTAKLEQMKTAVAKTSTKHSSTYLAALPKVITGESVDLTNLGRMENYSSVIANYADMGKKVNEFYSLIDTGSKTKYNPYPQYNTALDYLTYISKKTRDLYPIATALNKEIALQKTLRTNLKTNKNQEDYDSSKYIRQIFDSVSSMSKITGTRESLMPENTDKAKSDNGKMDWTKNTNQYVTYVDELFKTTQNTVIQSWSEISQSFIDDAATYEKVIKDYNQYASVFQRGFAKPLTEAQYNNFKQDPAALLAYAKAHASEKAENAKYFYPDLSLVMTENMENVSKNYEQAMNSAQEEFEYNLQNHPEWKNNKQITDIVNNSASYMNKKSVELASMRESASAVVSKAKTDIAAAEEAKKQGDKYYSDSVGAYNKEKFEQAEDLLVKASEKYTEALELKEDPELRSSIDKKQSELSMKIIDGRNEIVIRESRALYTKARNAQTADNYDDAEIFINQAIAKWAETHDEENEEFADLRNLINTAVSMKTGRVLTISDPLYAEMSQLLSIAYQYYDKGKVYYDKKQKEQGDAALVLAVENLQKIKKVYPINQEASLLMLKIDQLQDPEKFKAEFGQRINDAVAKCKSSATQIEGYNELMTYYNLDPNYKGLKDTVYNIEIQLGLRERPIDNSAIARARRLTEEARSLYNSAGNDSDKLNRALDRVKQALALNPNYTTAEQLKDRIETKLGGSAVIVLSSADNALLTRAKNEYQAGRIDEANLIMIQLLNNNPQNIKVKSVSDLKKKIDARL